MSASAGFASAARLLCVIGVAAATLLLAACGGSSSTRSASTPTAYAAAKTAHDPVTNGVVTHRPFPGTGGGETNDDNPGNADAPGKTSVRRSAGPVDPCSLVSRAEAQAIVGRPIGTPVDAPLGPTCIYQPAGAKSFITLKVESIDLAAIKPQIRNRTQLIRGHTAYCGSYGQPTTFVPLAAGRVLAVTAPCAIGVRFAAAALPRMRT